MADKIEKFVAKLSMKDTEIYRDIVKAILSHDLELYDVKKLLGNRDENTYRKY